jgi:hypothetical protein
MDDDLTEDDLLARGPGRSGPAVAPHGDGEDG